MRKNKSIGTGGLWQDFLREPAPMRIEGLQLFWTPLFFERPPADLYETAFTRTAFPAAIKSQYDKLV